MTAPYEYTAKVSVSFAAKREETLRRVDFIMSPDSFALYSDLTLKFGQNFSPFVYSFSEPNVNGSNTVQLGLGIAEKHERHSPVGGYQEVSKAIAKPNTMTAIIQIVSDGVDGEHTWRPCARKV